MYVKIYVNREKTFLGFGVNTIHLRHNSVLIFYEMTENEVPTHFISSSRDFPLISFETSTQLDQHSTNPRDALLSNDPLIPRPWESQMPASERLNTWLDQARDQPRKGLSHDSAYGLVMAQTFPWLISGLISSCIKPFFGWHLAFSRSGN